MLTTTTTTTVDDTNPAVNLRTLNYGKSSVCGRILLSVVGGVGT